MNSQQFIHQTIRHTPSVFRDRNLVIVRDFRQGDLILFHYKSIHSLYIGVLFHYKYDSPRVDGR